MYLSDKVQNHLRNLNHITSNEVVEKNGDLFIAINVLTSERRVLSIDKSLIEGFEKIKSSKRILKG